MKGIFLKQTNGKSIASDNLQLHHVQISVIKQWNKKKPTHQPQTKAVAPMFKIQHTVERKKVKKKERKNRKNEIARPEQHIEQLPPKSLFLNEVIL